MNFQPYENLWKQQKANTDAKISFPIWLYFFAIGVIVREVWTVAFPFLFFNEGNVNASTPQLEVSAATMVNNVGLQCSSNISELINDLSLQIVDSYSLK